MRIRPPLAFLAAFVAAGILAATARATTVTTNLFAEAFSTATGQWVGTSGFKSDRTWTKDGTVYGALGGAKLGTSTKVGSITSELIPLRVANTTTALSIYVQAAAYSNQTGKLVLAAVDENGDSLHSWTTNLVAANVATATDLSDMASAAAFDFTFDFTTAVPFKLVLTTGNSSGSGDKRVLVGEVRVTETYEEVEDPWEPVWTVGTPTPAPRVGTAFSFGVAAALADGTPQTVAFGGLTPAAAGAQPSFANGVFSWTPGEDAAGSYTAAFSVQNAGGTYTTDVAIAVRGATEETELFWEDFPNYDNAWSGTATVTLPTTDTRKTGWTGLNLYKGRSAIKLGKANAADYGSATTPTIETANGAAATVTLTLDAAAYAEKTGTLGITAADADTSAVLLSTNVTLTAMASTSVADLSAYPIGPILFAAAGRFKITFAPVSGDGRMGIDSVKVTQAVSTSLTDLDVPTGLAVVDGTLSTNSFAIAWAAVSNATAYTAEVYEGASATAAATTNLAATTVAFAGLADDTTYRVRVRAEGDTTLYNYSDWTNLTVRTVRSSLHPTLSVGPWSNAAGENKLYGVIPNTAAVSAALDDATPVEVALAGVAPAPSSAPDLEDGALAWTPAAADEGTTFTLTFAMTPAAGVVYTTNLSFKVNALPDLKPPTVTAGPVAWDAFGLSWNTQYRAAGYAVRVWTDCPNPAATAMRIDESFAGFAAGVMPSGWTLSIPSLNSEFFYKDDKAPVKLAESTHSIETYDLGGPISSVSFHAAGHSIAGSASTLTVVGIAADDTETVLATLTASDIGQTDAGIDRTYSVSEGAGIRRIAWRYTKDRGGVGVGSVVIEGSGFSTPRWLPGWGPAAKGVGLVQGCTVAHPRPGRVLGVDPADKKADLTEDRIHYAEVAVAGTNADGGAVSFAAVVPVGVPAPPRSVRATMLILR